MRDRMARSSFAKASADGLNGRPAGGADDAPETAKPLVRNRKNQGGGPADCRNCSELEMYSDGVWQRYKCKLGGGQIDGQDLKMGMALCAFGGPFKRRQTMGKGKVDWILEYDGKPLWQILLALRENATELTWDGIAEYLNEQYDLALTGKSCHLAGRRWRGRTDNLSRGELIARGRQKKRSAFAKATADGLYGRPADGLDGRPADGADDEPIESGKAVPRTAAPAVAKAMAGGADDAPETGSRGLQIAETAEQDPFADTEEGPPYGWPSCELQLRLPGIVTIVEGKGVAEFYTRLEQAAMIAIQVLRGKPGFTQLIGISGLVQKAEDN